MRPPAPRTIPPLLHPYTTLPPPTSLILLTSVLNASTNWLLLRFLCGALASDERGEREKGRREGPEHQGRGDGGREGEGELEGEKKGEGEVKIVFVSFVREYEFWRREAARCGLDFPRLMAAGKLVFVDGLTALFSSSSEGGVVEKGVGQGVKVLRSASGVDVEREVREVAEGLKGGEGAGRMARVVLVLDQPDVVLAATGTGTGTGMGTSTTSSGAGGAGGMGMDEVVASLRQYVHSTIITTAADFPLLQAPTTPLEINHSAFVVGLAHLARWTVSLRGLDTGSARDVSGVLRVTRGVLEEDDDGKGEEGEERELLYFVGGDGGVRVFERGA